jgi:peptidoglycan hydrolase CwlO-like protein
MSNPVKGIVYIIVVLLALSAVVGLGAWLAGRHYQPTIDNLNDKLSKCSSLKDQANAIIMSHNSAIAALQQAGVDREKAAKAAVESARASAKDDYGKANDVLAERVDSPDVCAAASSAFDAELARERAK